MSKLKETDFYYGAVLSTLINQGICPALVESGQDRQIYDFTTDEKEFRLFVKYRSHPIPTKSEDYSSWQFTFSPNDITELKHFLTLDKHLCVGLVCGKEKLGDSEYAVIYKEELGQLFEAGKKSLTISRKTGERYFRISVGGGRENAIQIRCNNLY